MKEVNVFMVGEKIKRTRISKHLTQSELADAAGLSITYIQQLEYGNKKNPSIKTLTKLSNALGIDMGVLLREPTLFDEPSFNKLDLTEDQKKELNDLFLTDRGKGLNRLGEIMDSQGDLDKKNKLVLIQHVINSTGGIDFSFVSNQVSQDKVLNGMYQKLLDLGYLVEAMDNGFRINNKTSGDIYFLSTQEVKDLYDDAENYLKSGLAALDEPSVWVDRYYTPGPPDAPGAAPGGAVDWQDFGEPIPVEGLGLPAHGWVEYDRPLSPGQAKAYGLRVIKDL